ncbi:hypothetical protein [Tahibacter soli]|uniref:Uncharacterized protein n=1 Tax=Tahibacter soli TaxID=2983605 RepID=A0A9X4BKM8_9GAMM|nr:hypothetical protein [Tahibacter soli]MDC8015883.1 hypothetical protein [Tahibacter soli]
MHGLDTHRLRQIYEPKLLTVLRGGYRAHDLRRDLVAGLTVAIVALPLAVSIFSSQIKDLFGLHMGAVPAEFFDRWRAYAEHAGTFTPTTVLLAAASLALNLAIRRWRPAWPGFLIAVIAAAVAAPAAARPSLASRMPRSC